MSPAPRPRTVVLLGAGAWACTAHLPALAAREGLVLAAVYDPDPGRAQDAAREFGIRRVATDVADALRDGPDGCVVASPAVVHADQAESALRAGAHVLLEKPMTNDARDAWRVAELAASTGREVLLAFGWNYSPVFAAARRMLAERPIGELEHATLHMASGVRELLSGESIDSSGRPDRPALGATWTDPAVSGGGYGNAQLSHGLGAFLALAGEGAGQVVAHARPGPLPGIELGVAISGVLTSGATFSASGVAIHPGWRGGRQQLEVRLFGSEGQLHVDFLRDRVAHSAPDGSETLADLAEGAGSYPGTAPATAFGALLTGEPVVNESDAVVGARTTEVLDAVRAAVAA